MSATADALDSYHVGTALLNSKVLVLNRSYLPVHVTSVKRAFALLYQGVARAVDEQYRTCVPHIFAVGDVIGFPALASTSMEQGRLAVCHGFGVTINALQRVRA